MMHRVFTILIALILLFMLSLVTSPQALGQTPQQDSAADAAPEADAANDICEEIHWIINVRSCQSDGCDKACSCQFHYEWEDCCGNRGWSDVDGFRQWLKPGVPVCLMVHGSFVPEDSVYADCRNTFKWLRGAAPKRQLQMVFLSWPSDGIFTSRSDQALTSPVPGIDVAILGRRAERNGILLARLMHLLPPDSPVCLIGHSHGARIVSSALHLLGGGSQRGVRVGAVPQRIRTILAAAAIDHDWYISGQRYDHALYATECLLNLRCQRDWALFFYPLREPFSPHALGRGGFTRRDLQRLGPEAQRLWELDVTPVINRGHIWPEYYEHPELAASLVPWVYFD